MNGISYESMKQRAVAELERGSVREAWASLSSDLNKSEAGRHALGKLNMNEGIGVMIRESDDTRFWSLLEKLAPKKGMKEDPYASS